MFLKPLHNVKFIIRSHDALRQSKRDQRRNRFCETADLNTLATYATQLGKIIYIQISEKETSLLRRNVSKYICIVGITLSREQFSGHSKYSLIHVCSKISRSLLLLFLYHITTTATTTITTAAATTTITTAAATTTTTITTAAATTTTTTITTAATTTILILAFWGCSS